MNWTGTSTLDDEKIPARMPLPYSKIRLHIEDRYSQVSHSKFAALRVRNVLTSSNDLTEISLVL